MNRRIGLSVLWFFAVWTAASMLAFALLLPGWIVPIMALIAAIAVLRQGADVRRAMMLLGVDRVLAGR